MAFFEVARQAGLIVEKVVEKVMEKVLFEEDRGVGTSSLKRVLERDGADSMLLKDELLRRTVFGYQLRWPGQNDIQG